MSVLCECLSVIVPVAVLEADFPGGQDAYRASVPNATYCTDGVLTRVGFMVPADVGTWVGQLSRHVAVATAEQDRFIDAVVIDQLHGPTLPCVWVRWERRDDLTRAWIGDAPGVIAVPDGWEPTAMTLHRPGADGRLAFEGGALLDANGIFTERFTSRVFDGEREM